MTKQQDPNWVWDKYWAADRIAACFEGAQGNYSGDIAYAWRRFFGSLAPSAQILDIGTGNGAIALLARQCSNSHDFDFDIHGIDCADINPAAYVTAHQQELESIQFHAHTPTEKTHFEPASFAAVTGQYALEYTHLEASVAEIFRVLAAKGKIRFMLHARDSIAYKGALIDLKQIRFILEKTRFMRDGRQLIQALLATSPPKNLTKLKQSYSKSCQQVLKKLRASNRPGMLNNLLKNMDLMISSPAQFSLQSMMAQCDELVTELSAHQGRLQALKQAALSEQGIADLLGILARCQFIDLGYEPAFQQDPKRLAGWWLWATKNGA